ncbi:hypothetical protein VQ056_18965 [Paenibacillus sp. JTLBN-2024]|jgi:hypothetical protein
MILLIFIPPQERFSERIAALFYSDEQGSRKVSAYGEEFPFWFGGFGRCGTPDKRLRTASQKAAGLDKKS